MLTNELSCCKIFGSPVVFFTGFSGVIHLCNVWHTVFARENSLLDAAWLSTSVCCQQTYPYRTYQRAPSFWPITVHVSVFVDVVLDTTIEPTPPTSQWVLTMAHVAMTTKNDKKSSLAEVFLSLSATAILFDDNVVVQNIQCTFFVKGNCSPSQHVILSKMAVL